MFLDNYNFNYGLNEDKYDFKYYFKFYCNYLFEYCLKLFTVETNLDTIPNHEIPTLLFLHGKCAITEFPSIHGNKKGLYASRVTMNTNTHYPDIFKKAVCQTMIESVEKTIDKDCIIIKNNSLMTPLIHTIRVHARELAHNELSFISNSINSRNVKAFSCIDDRYKSDAEEYYKKIRDGRSAVFVNKGFSAIEQVDVGTVVSVDYLENKDRILNMFFESLGIKKASDKRERLIESEVTTNELLLKLNVKDMFDNWKKSFEECNKMFGTNITIKSNIEFTSDNSDKGVEDERE